MNRWHELKTLRITAVGALCVVAGLLAGGSACSSSSQVDEGQPKDGGSARASADLVAMVNEILQLRSSDVVTLTIDETPDAVATVDLPIARSYFTLDLHPQSVRAANYQLKVQLADGSLIDAQPGPVRTLRGTVVGFEGSAVAASLREDGLHARIFFSDDEQYWVEPVASRVPQAGPNHYAIYHNDDIIAPQKACGLDALADPTGGRDALGTVRHARAGACDTGLCVAELAADADYEYYVAYGSVGAVEAQINQVVNAVNVQYERDVDITHALTTIIVRTSEPDPYTHTDATQLLYQFRAHWLTYHGNIQRDTAQLFTGRSLNGGTIGIAWLNAICTDLGFSVVESDFNGNFGCATDLTAHELGHNWGADHCSCSLYTMNPYITCANRFHSTLSIPEIVSFRDTRSCLDGGSGCSNNSDCDDGDLCTVDTCSGGSCSNAPINCDDGDACNGVETCDPGTGDCLAGTPLDCDDDNACTTDSCSGGACSNVPSVDCDDGDACTTDSCDPASGLCSNDAINCDDGDDCTVDSCDPASGCVNEPTGGSCCGDGVCEAGEDCGSCAADCISGGGAPGCGNGVCEAGEDCLNCSADCRGKQNGKPSNRYCCSGDGAGGGENPVDCADPRCTSSGYQCGSADPYCCGDGFCEGAEDVCNCGVDCPGAAADESGMCADGLDNDCDGATDCGDGDCTGDPSCDCGGNQSPCTTNSDCCSNNCKNGTCRGN